MRRDFLATGRRAAFTLVEVLVSMTVLVLLIALVSQIVNSTANLTKNSGKHMDSDSQARDVFDRLAVDIAGMVLRPDADTLFVKSAGNDKMFFYSETPAYFSADASGATPSLQNDSPLSLIGYRVNQNLTPLLQLERLGKGLTWTGTPNGVQGGAAVFLTFPTPNPTPTPGTAAVSPTPSPVPGSTLAGNWTNAIGSSPGYNDGVDADYRVLSSNVFRLEFCFLMKNGMLSPQPYTAPNTSPKGMQDVSAIIVAIGILDDSSRKIVTNTSQLVSALKDFPVSDDQQEAAINPLMATLWQDQINASTFAQSAGLPAEAASAVRVYQRFFYLNTK